jgi:hypothetical protein
MADGRSEKKDYSDYAKELLCELSNSLLDRIPEKSPVLFSSTEIEITKMFLSLIHCDCECKKGRI